MTRLIPLYRRATTRLEALSDGLLPLLARLTFAATLVGYFWASARTKLGDGVLGFCLLYTSPSPRD